jgi:hypothetical protein
MQELEDRKSQLNYAGGQQLFLPLKNHVDPANSALEFVPETLTNFIWHDGFWEFTFEGYQRRNQWSRPLEKNKHLKARLTISSATLERSPSFSCVDDKLQETACP